MENESKTKFPGRTFIGFTIFDALHIICAVAKLVLAFNEPVVDEIIIAQCNVEIVLSLLLFAFIASLAKFQSNKELFHASYTYAWLCAFASVMVPLSFLIPRLLEATWEGHQEIAQYVLLIIALVLSLILFCVFLASLIFKKKSRRWTNIIRVALILVLVLPPLTLTLDILVGGQPFDVALECIKDLAPVFPAVIGLSLWGNRDFCGFDEN